MTDGVDQTARDGVKRAEVSLEKMVPREVYNLGQLNQDNQIKELARDIVTLEAKVDKQEERQRNIRMTLLASFLLPIAVALVLAYVYSQIGATPR